MHHTNTSYESNKIEFRSFESLNIIWYKIWMLWLIWKFDEILVEKVLPLLTVVKMSQSPFYWLTWSHSDISISKESYWEYTSYKHIIEVEKDCV